MKSKQKSLIDPATLSELQSEAEFAQALSTSQQKAENEKVHAWHIRFLPADLGPKTLFYARIAKHWLAMKHIVCPRLTAPAFGGDPDAYCPECKWSTQLQHSVNSAESDLG